MYIYDVTWKQETESLGEVNRIYYSQGFSERYFLVNVVSWDYSALERVKGLYAICRKQEVMAGHRLIVLWYLSIWRTLSATVLLVPEFYCSLEWPVFA